MIRVNHARLLFLVTVASLAACSGGGSTGGLKTGGDFVVLKTQPSDNATLFLNDTIAIDFSQPVALDSVNLSTFTFEVRDQFGNVVPEPVAGRFKLSASPGDLEPGRRLEFEPVLPTDDLFVTGGFKPGREYRVQLVGGNVTNGTVLRDQRGKGLALPVSFRFVTADGTTPGQLFRNIAPGGPRVAGIDISPTPDASGVVLNKLGSPAVEVRVRFDQPLNPSSVNVPVRIPIDPLTRSGGNRGRAFLEYDDPEFGEAIWIPAEAELELNALTGATLLLRPAGVLPNNALVRVVVERTLEDISGESNVSNAAYDRVVGSFRTRRAYEQQFDALVEDFVSSSAIDFTAAFAEPQAEVGPGFLKAGFAFEGFSTGADFNPAVPTTVLNTNSTQVQPANPGSAPFTVSGGVFNFRNVHIQAGRTVVGQGSNPMVWLVSGTFRVDGTLSVRGGDAPLSTSTGNANVPKAGGAGACGGGDGGAGSPSTTQRDAFGETGKGARQVVGGGGRGGELACVAGCNRGSGGGGGSMATQGDPHYKVKTIEAGGAGGGVFPIFQQQTGTGGNGCIGAAGTVTRSLNGGTPGPTVFTDARADNNFWGAGLRLDGSPLRITGELSVPIGGSGGGGGGDLSSSNCDIDDVNFQNDFSGGGGGGGGGVLIVKALGPIVIGAGGRITADGGHGIGGETGGSSSKGGGGGGGAGGMVVLMSAQQIDINVRGSGSRFLYGGTGADNNDYDFSISADGGICRTGVFGGSAITSKYPASGTAVPTSFRTTYDAAPLGGFGGMGIVQLMAPPGDNSFDNTNTILDDNIRVYRNESEQLGDSKERLLAWRGFPNQLGVGVDDFGVEIVLGPGTSNDNEGDIRPSPVLMPTPVAAASRVRSKWIDTGATRRRGLTVEDNLPRGIVEQGGAQRGPRYEFAGVDTTSGYAQYVLNGLVANSSFPTIVEPTPIESVDTSASHLGQPAYRVVLAQPAMGSVADRYTQYEAEVRDAFNETIGSFRILTHTDRELVLATESGAFPAAATSVRVRAKFFEIVTNGTLGQGATYLTQSSGQRVPIANVRIGFAFHQDPSEPTAQRFPAAAGEYVYNLSDPAVQETVRALGAAFVQWDVLFDMAFDPGNEGARPLSPDTPRPELHFLRLPFRF